MLPQRRRGFFSLRSDLPFFLAEVGPPFWRRNFSHLLHFFFFFFNPPRNPSSSCDRLPASPKQKGHRNKTSPISRNFFLASFFRLWGMVVFKAEADSRPGYPVPPQRHDGGRRAAFSSPFLEPFELRTSTSVHADTEFRALTCFLLLSSNRKDPLPSPSPPTGEHRLSDNFHNWS